MAKIEKSKVYLSKQQKIFGKLPDEEIVLGLKDKIWAFLAYVRLYVMFIRVIPIRLNIFGLTRLLA